MWARRVLLLSKAYIAVSRVLCLSLTEVIQSSRFGYVWGSFKLTGDPGSVRKRYITHESSAGYVARAYRTHVRYKNNIPVPRVFVALAYRTFTSSGYGYECPTELTEVLCRVIPGVNTPGMVTPGMVCMCPTEHSLARFSSHPGAFRLHHICVLHRLPVACPPPLRERRIGESVFRGPSWEGCLAPLAVCRGTNSINRHIK